MVLGEVAPALKEPGDVVPDAFARRCVSLRLDETVVKIAKDPSSGLVVRWSFAFPYSQVITQCTDSSRVQPTPSSRTNPRASRGFPNPRQRVPDPTALRFCEPAAFRIRPGGVPRASGHAPSAAGPQPVPRPGQGRRNTPLQGMPDHPAMVMYAPPPGLALRPCCGETQTGADARAGVGAGPCDGRPADLPEVRAAVLHLPLQNARLLPGMP